MIYFLVIIFLAPFLLVLPGVIEANMIIGGETVYIVKKGDSFELIGARLGVHWKNIPKENGLEMDKNPEPGTRLRVTTRKIVPRLLDNGILVNIPDRTLYLFKAGSLITFPIGVGKAVEDEAGNWKTTTGKFRIVGKKTNPTWYVPDSIQIEAALKGKWVDEVVPPGRGNPLGKHALVTTIPGVLIHETIYPSSVYRYRSHGCIRVLPEHMKELFPLVEVNTPGEIIYEPVKVAVTDNGKTYLEVRTDAYRRVGSLREHTRKVIEAKGLSDKVAWKKVDMLVKTESGIAEDVSPTPIKVQVASQAPQRSFTQKMFETIKSFWD